MPVFFTTLLAASLALNVALVLEIYRSSGETAPVTVVGEGTTDDSTPEGSSGASATPPVTTPTTPSPATGAAAARKQPPAATRPKATRPTARAKAAAAATRPRTAKTAKQPAVTTKQAEARKQAPARAAQGVSLSWDPAQGATFYNVVLWRDDTRLLDLWPTDPKVRIPESWTYAGKTRQLEPGRYLWFAFAGYGSGEDRRLGERVASGNVVVPPA